MKLKFSNSTYFNFDHFGYIFVYWMLVNLVRLQMEYYVLYWPKYKTITSSWLIVWEMQGSFTRKVQHILYRYFPEKFEMVKGSCIFNTGKYDIITYNLFTYL